MRVVIDTNVIFSGIFFGGLPRVILESVLNGDY
jgi:predicted nucleic acid-binding protein